MAEVGGRRCKATTRAGDPCAMAPLEGQHYCFAHAPERAMERAKARKRGGKASATARLFRLPAAPEALRDVRAIQTVLERTVAETLVQRNSAMRSRAIGSLLLIALRGLEVGELAQRLEALEQVISRGPRRTA